MLKFALQAVSAPGPGLAIFIFHRVLQAPDPLNPSEPAAERFRVLLRWIKNWFNVMPLDKAIIELKGRRLPPRAAALTFDDGYADNAEIALPLLREVGLSATFFVASGYLDGGRMWNDSVIEAVRAFDGELLDLRAIGLGEFPLQTPEARARAISQILTSIKHLDPVARERRVEYITDKAGRALRDDLMMSSRQVKLLHDSGMTIGAHTVNHPILAAIDDALARREICEGKSRLEEIIGERISLFAYPNGRPHRDYSAQHVAMARAAGFSAAVTTSWAMARPDGDPFQLPRFTPWQRSRTGFALELIRNALRTPDRVPATAT
jgi:peptidoglycan/xylan/chitin deacetylase (PgdA/CDA1 family)